MKCLFHDNKNRTYEKISQQHFLKLLLLLSKLEKKVLNKFVDYSNKFLAVYPRQDTIAYLLGCSLKTVNRAVDKLFKVGLLDRWYRQAKSCVYYLNPLLNDLSLRRFLAPIIPTLGFFTIAWLQPLEQNVSQLNLFNYLNIYKNNKRDSLTTKKMVYEEENDPIISPSSSSMSKLFDNDDHPSYDNAAQKPQKRERIQTIPAFKTSMPNALRCKAQSLWLLVQQDRMSLDRARRELQQRQDQYPEGIANLKEWYGTPEGSQFKEWIDQWP